MEKIKTFNRASLPDFINYKGDKYILAKTQFVFSGSIIDKINLFKTSGLKVLIVNVLPKSLKNKIDLHGELYKPTQWLFVK